MVQYRPEQTIHQWQQYKQKQRRNQEQNQKLFKCLFYGIVGSMFVVFMDAPEVRALFNSMGIERIGVRTLKWVPIGFAISLVIRSSFLYLFSNLARRIVHPRYLENGSQEDISLQAKILVKTGYDIVIHLSVVVFTFYSFREEPWFPMALGGQGRFSDLFWRFPNLPLHLGESIQAFYFLQLGHNFHLIALVLFLDGGQWIKQHRYQLLFHHAVTCVMILASLLYNAVCQGVIVMFIHDFSDLFRAVNHLIDSSVWAVYYLPLAKVIRYAYVAIWTYMRIFMLGCVINEVHENTPDQFHTFYEYRLNQVYMVIYLTALFFLQCYWTALLFINYDRVFKLHEHYQQKIKEKSWSERSNRVQIM